MNKPTANTTKATPAIDNAAKARDVIIQGDAIEVLKGLPEKSVDLVFGSPPYEDCRTYGISFGLKGQVWVDWMVQVVKASLRASKGLVAFVVEGPTHDFQWSATPALLMADLHRAGICLRNPPAFERVGIAGSGGPDWLRNDYEFIVCATNGGKLSWSDNTAMGHRPKWAPGGEMSHRVSSGARVNQWGHAIDTGGTVTDEGGVTRSKTRRPSHKLHTKRRQDGTMETQGYIAPAVANPGNVIRCKVGGGQMGHDLCHENEAPFPEYLAEFFIRSFCKPGGLICDPFCGSGTTCAVAAMHDRHYIGIDIRRSQVELARERIGASLKPETYSKADTPPGSPLFAEGAKQ